MQRGSTVFRQDLAITLQENNLGRDWFVGEKIMPVMGVGARSGEFGKIAFGEVKTKAVDDKKSGTGNYNEVTHEVTSDTYTCVKRGLIEVVGDDDDAALKNYFNAEVKAADLISYYLRLNRDARVSAIAFDTTVMASYTAAVATPWSTIATSTPIADVMSAIENVQLQLNGMADGTTRLIGVGNLTARRYLNTATEIKNKVNGGGDIQRGALSDAQLATILNLDAVYFSGLKRGGSYVWNAGRFGVYQVSESDNLEVDPQFGKIMLWRDSTPQDMMVETYRNEDREGEVVRVKHNTVEKLLTARAGYLLTNIS